MGRAATGTRAGRAASAALGRAGITATLQPGPCAIATCKAAVGQVVVCVDGFDAECAGPGWVSACDEGDNRATGAGCP